MWLFACKNVPVLQYSLFSYQVFQGCHHFRMLQMQKKKKKTKGKKRMDHEPSFPVTLLFLFELLQSHVIKNRCYGCVCVCVQECVCVFAQVPEKNPALCTTCACAERANASGSPLENRAAPRSASLFIITVWNKAWIMQTAGTRLVCGGGCFLTGRGPKTQSCICFVWHMDCFLCPLFQSPTTNTTHSRWGTDISWSRKPQSAWSK